MERIFFCFLFTLVSMAGFAQRSAQATATASIVTPVGLVSTAEVSSLSFSATGKTTGGKMQPGSLYRHTIEMATLKIVGAGNNLYSVSLAPAMLSLSSNAQSEPLLLQQFHVSGACNGQEEYSLQAMLLLPAPTRAGHYSNQAPLNLTVNFN